MAFRTRRNKMNYEQKYKEALKRAKVEQETFFNLGNISAKTAIERIFPELRESEDEKIRKDIIRIFKGEILYTSKEENEKYIAWLEKQGEQNTANFEEAEKEKNDFVSGQFIECRKSFNEFKEFESYWFEYVGDDTYIGRSDNILNQRFYITPQQLFTLFTHQHCPKDNKKQGENELEKYINNERNKKDFYCEGKEMSWNEMSLNVRKHDYPYYFKGDLDCYPFNVEKQGEQNPVEKVEPKFKVGDWVVSDKGETARIVEIWKDSYGILRYYIEWKDCNMTSPMTWFVDDKFHLWTIQDARDGDVLCYRDEVFILKNYVLFHKIIYHCCYDGENFIPHSIYSLTKDDFNKVHPATKEARDQLDKAMTTAGYVFDFEKKELNKIEQSCYHNDGLYYAIDILEKTLGKVEGYQSDDGIVEHQTAIETVNALYHKKPADWSEKDKIMIDNIIWSIQMKSIKPLDEMSDGGEYKKYEDFLKSLPKRFNLQPKQKWSEEDERNLKGIIDEIEANKSDAPDYDLATYDRFLFWLKSLKNRVQSHQKQGWSEEDNERLLRIHQFIWTNRRGDTDEIYQQEQDADWLMTLKPHWKPSEEQLKALWETIPSNPNSEKDIDVITELSTLYDDLKKL